MICYLKDNLKMELLCSAAILESDYCRTKTFKHDEVLTKGCQLKKVLSHLPRKQERHECVTFYNKKEIGVFW